MLIRNRVQNVARARAAILIAAIVAVSASLVAAQAGTGTIRVDVSDSSGARLPGVTVVVSTAAGRATATAVTDGTGTYVFRAVPAGPVMVRLRREGFTGILVGVTVEPGAESQITQRLELAPIAETVDVEAPAPVEPPPPPPPPPPAPVAPRGPLLKPVPAHDRDSVCGPAKPSGATEPLGTIRSSRYVAGGGLYTIGGQILIDGGALNGLEVGQNLVVRRYFRVQPFAGSDTTGEHSSGMVQIVSASERSAVAVVIYACDALRNGDFLVPFRPESVRPVDPRGVPDYEGAARILFADEAQTLGAPRRLMVIDRGSRLGVRVGQRLTLFRRSGGRPEVTGDAVVVAVRTDSATIRIERVTNAVSTGDMAAPQIPAPAGSR